MNGAFFYPGSARPVNGTVDPVLRVFDYSAVARGKDWPGHGWLAETATRQRTVILCVSTAFLCSPEARLSSHPSLSVVL